LETPPVIDAINTGGKCRYRLIGLIKQPNAAADIHLAGQRVVLGLAGGSVTGVGVGWAQYHTSGV
jgi:hypothetical protein